jgi:dCTP diphosphatase
MRTFTDDRDWGQFHDPKSLILALVGEVGEVSELFQWLPSQEARDLASTGQLHRRAAEELSDVLLYLVRLADVLGIDLIEAANAKLDHAESRFSPPNVKGIAPSKE